ncbi:MAG: Ldh family oxidoreductase [Candidatus Brocadiia bacterium]|nr:Ldh family oxidoreductase [Candidatus Brocadiia bacterium]
MKVFSADYLRQVGVDLFTACGAPAEEAACVADELVEASLMGLESHGVTRYILYAEHVLEGKIKPGAPIRVVKETPSTAVIDCGFNFGPVGARRMVEVVCEKALRSDVASVVSENCHHVARVGSYAQKVAERDMFCIATANSTKHGHFVVPWGGREGRLATNPIAFAAPTGGVPVVMDMATSMISEGKIRVLMHGGEPVPPGRVLDAGGNATTDPKAFYGPLEGTGPPEGTILPLGGELGYKGFGLGLLVEILSGIMAGKSTALDHPHINGLSLLAINPAAFCGAGRFKELMDELCAYMTTTPPAPGHSEVVMPGALDFRMREKRLAEGIPLPEETWHLIVGAAERVGLMIDEV